MAKWVKGDKLKIKTGIEGSRIGGYPVTVFKVDETTLKDKVMYMVELRDPAMLDGEKVGTFFYILEENLVEAEEGAGYGSDETSV